MDMTSKDCFRGRVVADLCSCTHAKALCYDSSFLKLLHSLWIGPEAGHKGSFGLNKLRSASYPALLRCQLNLSFSFRFIALIWLSIYCSGVYRVL